MNHTYVILEVSLAAYEEIAEKLRVVGHGRAFGEDGVINMRGIGLRLKLDAEEIEDAAIFRQSRR